MPKLTPTNAFNDAYWPAAVNDNQHNGEHIENYYEPTHIRNR